MRTGSNSQVAEEPASEAKPVEKRWGAVAMIDALGFKGIWRRSDIEPQHIARKMQRMRDEVLALAADWSDVMRDHKGQAVAQVVSDMFIFGASAEASQVAVEPRFYRSALLEVACFVVRSLLQSGLNDKPYLSFRGCIAVGDVWTSKDMIVGEAVDTAATWYEQSDAATVWMIPDAAKIAEFDEGPWFRWQVPLHRGGALDTYVVDPELDGQVSDGVGSDTYAKRLLESFDTSQPDVCIKRDRTAAMLQAEKAHRKRKT